jgi:hypothetical protein
LDNPVIFSILKILGSDAFREMRSFKEFTRDKNNPEVSLSLTIEFIPA